MSLNDVEDLLAARSIVVSYETIRAWVAQLGLQYAKAIRRVSVAKFPAGRR